MTEERNNMAQILNRYNGNVIAEGEMSLLELVTRVVKTAKVKESRADLMGADLMGADLAGADLMGADLRGADLMGADLAGADLMGADLRGADLRGADLMGADLRGADLMGADLAGADLRGADLMGADLAGAYLNNVKIKHSTVFTGLYKYLAMPVISEDGAEYIRLGCHFRSVEDWETDFWNNDKEFPNNGDKGSKLRWLAYQTCLQWLALHREAL